MKSDDIVYRLRKRPDARSFSLRTACMVTMRSCRVAPPCRPRLFIKRGNAGG